MSRRLHVLVVPAWYPSPEDPVAGIFVRDQARVVALNHDVTVLAPPSAAAPVAVVEDGVRVIRLPAARTGRRLTRRMAELRAMSAAVARLQEEGRPPDIVHAHVYSAGFLAVLIGFRWRLPVIVSEHLSDVLEGKLVGYEARVARFTYRHADLVCPVSALLDESLAHLEPRSRREVVGNVVDIEAFAGLPRPDRDDRRTCVLAVASLDGYKGLHYLLDAVRILLPDHPDVALKIVGEGPDRALLEARGRGLPVTFLGARSRDEVAAHMREADVLAMPSLVETFGIAAVEALVAGLPVVVTSACGAADLVATHGGLVIPPADVPALCDALRTLLDGAVRVSPGTVDDLRQSYGPDAIGHRWDFIYCTLVRKLPR